MIIITIGMFILILCIFSIIKCYDTELSIEFFKLFKFSFKSKQKK